MAYASHVDVCTVGAAAGARRHQCALINSVRLRRVCTGFLPAGSTEGAQIWRNVPADFHWAPGSLRDLCRSVKLVRSPSNGLCINQPDVSCVRRRFASASISNTAYFGCYCRKVEPRRAFGDQLFLDGTGRVLRHVATCSELMWKWASLEQGTRALYQLLRGSALDLLLMLCKGARSRENSVCTGNVGVAVHLDFAIAMATPVKVSCCVYVWALLLHNVTEFLRFLWHACQKAC